MPAIEKSGLKKAESEQVKSPLGILAGAGMLPMALVQKCSAEGRDVAIVAISGAADVARFAPHIRAAFPIGRGRKMIRFFREHDVRDIVMIGAVRRPSFWDMRPDLWTLWRFGGAVLRGNLGDDGLLRLVRQVFEEEGFTLHGIQDYLPDLIAHPGALGQMTPEEDAMRDIRRGFDVLRALSPVDVGQAVVVQGGIVLGVEAAEGTSALITRCAALRRAGPGPILVKGAKAGQDRDLDLPTVGPQTVELAVRAGFRGIAVQAGATLMVDPADMTAQADKAKVFVVGV